MSPIVTANPQRSQQEEAQEQARKDASYYVGHAAGKLGARLGLTERYSLIHHSSLEEMRNTAKIAGHNSAEAAADAEIRHGKVDFRLTPPNLFLVQATLVILEEIARTSNQASATGQTLASMLMTELDQELCLFLTTLPLSEKLDHTDSGGPACQPVSHSDSDSDSGLRMLEGFDHTTLCHIRHLCSRLTQSSFQSLQKQQATKLTRSQNMLTTSLREGPQQILPSRPALQTSVTDMKNIASSHDFGDMKFGVQREGSVQEIQQEEDCLRNLLQVRMMLRCQPFIVICKGPAHMGSFMQLAKCCKLHLELLPSSYHLEQIKKFVEHGGNPPHHDCDMLLEVSCSPQTLQQHTLTEWLTSPPIKVFAAAIHNSGCGGITDVISRIRSLQRFARFECFTDDLPKVVLALYMELLCSQKPLSLMVVGEEYRAKQHAAATSDVELLQELTARVVNPDVFPELAKSKHILLFS